MLSPSPTSNLRDRITAPEILVTPGVYDAFSAYRAEVAGFEAVFVSGSALAATHLGRPDIGLLDASELSVIVARIAERVTIPIFVDADQGFGNSYAVARCVAMLERAGAAGIQIEDQQEIKPASAPLSRPLISLQIMTDKIHAALDARRDRSLMISARTDAMSSAGLGEALERTDAFIEAGADMVFAESISRKRDMEQLVRTVAGRVPILHNLLREGDDVSSAAELTELGYSVALFPGVALGAVGAALDNVFAALRSDPSTGKSAPDRIDGAAFLADRSAR
ncbi:isocitrate lyase/PEP mutase family protein [Parasphingopyxis algicola]|uniref:isocitrate lyase/PEP mutase family protein n=1 Tax=Parasphingopyxis algicola TaxID=2026624 RepID=UPI0015A224E5|nr:isocitrate lyase/PEP mutase family protein [Parasphingopyxis algicola]QLC26378.1 isocitrate lyase/PEP mutase family protein [Parasphingopyxis algicola]